MSIDLFETLSFSLLSEDYLFWKKVTQFLLLLSLVFEVKKKLVTLSKNQIFTMDLGELNRKKLLQKLIN